MRLGGCLKIARAGTFFRKVRANELRMTRRSGISFSPHSPDASETHPCRFSDGLSDLLIATDANSGKMPLLGKDVHFEMICGHSPPELKIIAPH